MNDGIRKKVYLSEKIDLEVYSHLVKRCGNIILKNIPTIPVPEIPADVKHAIRDDLATFMILNLLKS